MKTTLPHDMANWAQDLAQNLLSFVANLALGAILWSVLFLGIAVFLSFYLSFKLARSRLLLRHHLLWNIGAKLSYVVILLGLPLIGGALGLVYGMHRQIAPILAEQVQPAMERRMPQIRTYLASQIRTLRPHKMVSVESLIEPLIRDMSYKAQSGGLWEQKKAYWINQTVLRGGSELFSRTLRHVLAGQIESAGNALTHDNFSPQDSDELAGLSVDVLGQLASGDDFSKLDQSLPRTFIRGVQAHVDHYFATLYGSIGLFFLLLAMTIATEILIYRYFFLPAKTAGGAKAVMN